MRIFRRQIRRYLSGKDCNEHAQTEVSERPMNDAILHPLSDPEFARDCECVCLNV